MAATERLSNNGHTKLETKAKFSRTEKLIAAKNDDHSPRNQSRAKPGQQHRMSGRPCIKSNSGFLPKDTTRCIKTRRNFSFPIPANQGKYFSCLDLRRSIENGSAIAAWPIIEPYLIGSRRFGPSRRLSIEIPSRFANQSHMTAQLMPKSFDRSSVNTGDSAAVAINR